MNSKTPVKLLIDLIMAILFITLLDAYGTGLTFHEIAGLAIFALFALHILLNVSWVINVGKNLFNLKVKKKTKLMYVLNFSLFIGISTIAVTGILISQVLFHSLSSGNNHNLVVIHKLASYGCLGILGIHLALHWNYILNAVKNIYRNSKDSKGLRALKGIGAAAMVVVILYNIFSPDSDKVNAQSNQTLLSSQTAQFKNNSSSSSQDNTSINNSQYSTQNPPSLSDFLGSMVCTGCGKHCSLLALKCGKGNASLEAAKVKYQSQYGTISQ